MPKHPRFVTFVLVLSLAGCGGGDTSEEARFTNLPIQNASFDQASASGELAYWLASEHNQGNSYTFAATSDSAWSAPLSLKIHRYGIETFGAMNQLVPLQASWIGKTARLSAYLKTADAVDGGAGLTMQMLGGAGEILDWNHMNDAKVKLSQPWQTYSITLKILPKTSFISVGIMLEGGGTLWADDMKLELID